MAKYFKIYIKVAYDENSIPSDMKAQLEANVFRCVTNAELLNDTELAAEIEEWDVYVDG